MVVENEFSEAFSNAYDADAGGEGPVVCHPAGADWTCSYSDADLALMRATDSTFRLMERAEALAWSTLSALLGYRLSLCPVLVRPCTP
jgi:hypothetical protein